MTPGIKPYSDYKLSGVEWLGDVPAHWEVLPGRACYYEKKVPNTGMRETTVLSLSYGQIVVRPVEQLHGLVPASFETYQIIDSGDIVIRPTDLQNDWNSLRFGLSLHCGIITSAYMCFRTKGVMLREYGHLLLHTYDTKKIFYGLGSGLRQNLNWSDFKYLLCVVPPLAEQAAIVRYLDHVDGRIRRCIDARERLLGLLEEKRRTVIHRAVTRGLDPNVRLKPSGVEWLGDVPAHWEMRRLRNICELRVSNVDKHVKDDEQPVRLCNYVDVYKNDRIKSEMTFMRATATLGEIERFRLQSGDVLITKDSETWNDIGVPALVESIQDDIVSGYHLALLRPLPQSVIGEYLFRVLQSSTIAYHFHVEANGVTRYGLSHNAIKSVWLPLPPLAEQTAVAAHLDKATAAIDAAVACARRQIELLREYRARLTADVVTGKLDVREAAANLPDDITAAVDFDETDFSGAEA